MVFLQVKLCDLCLSALEWFVYHTRRYTSALLYLLPLRRDKNEMMMMMMMIMIISLLYLVFIFMWLYSFHGTTNRDTRLQK